MSAHLPSDPAKPPLQKPTLFARLTSPFVGLGLACFMAAGVLSNAYMALIEGRGVLPAQVSWPDFADGKVTGAIAGNMAHAPLPTGMAKLQRAAGWLVLGDLGPRVRKGCPGWLFLAEELMPHPGGAQAAAERARIVVRVHEQLRARGIGLMVAVVPDKSRIAAAELCGLRRSQALQDRVDRWTGQLAAAGVPVLDLATAMRELGAQGFLRTDTHWNEAGAHASARALAEALRQRRLAPPPDRRYAITAQPPAPRPGDMVRLAGLDWLPPALQPRPEMAVASRFTVVQDAASSAADDLFGDDNLPQVAAIGSSFTRTSNFVPFLSAELGLEVANFGLDGGKFAGGANAYFASAAFRQTPPKLVLWEIPERDLQTPVAGEQVTLAF